MVRNKTQANPEWEISQVNQIVHRTLKGGDSIKTIFSIDHSGRFKTCHKTVTCATLEGAIKCKEALLAKFRGCGNNRTISVEVIGITVCRTYQIPVGMTA